MARTKGLKRGLGKANARKDVDEDQSEAPPGTRVWHTPSMLTSGCGLDEMSRFDRNTGNFSHTVIIQHTDAFTLTPLLVTEGPLAGKHVMVLNPIKTFGFLDLPAEIRVMVYRYLIEEPSAIKITAYTPTGGLCRAVRLGFEDRTAHSKQGIKFDDGLGKYIGQGASNFALALVNKQMAAETAPIIYGDNSFRLQSLAELNIFLTAIGGMRAHLKHISVVSNKPYTSGKGRTTFDKLIPATNLRDLSISHRCVGRQTGGRAARGRVTIKKFIEDARPFLRALHKTVNARNATDAAETNVLDVIKLIEGDKCTGCSMLPGWCVEHGTNSPACDDEGIDGHITGVAEELRDAIAKELRIEQ